MKIETFFENAVRLATAPSLSSTPTIEVDKKDMKELTAYLEKQNIPHTVTSESELSFKCQNVQFSVVENEKDEMLDVNGKPMNAQKWEAVLSPEDQKVAEANTTPAADEIAVAPAPQEHPAWVAHENAEVLTDEKMAEGKEEKPLNLKQGKGK